MASYLANEITSTLCMVWELETPMKCKVRKQKSTKLSAEFHTQIHDWRERERDRERGDRRERMELWNINFQLIHGLISNGLMGEASKPKEIKFGVG